MSGGTANTAPYNPGDVAPADPGNINAPANPNPQAPNVIQTDPNTGVQYITVVVGGKLIQIPLNTQLQGDTVLEGGTGSSFLDALSGKQHAGPPLVSHQPTGFTELQVPGSKNKTSGTPLVNPPDTVLSKINSIQDWYKNAGTRQQIIEQMYQAGLITSKKAPSIEEVTMAWGLLVQEAALQSKGVGSIGLVTPEELLSRAAQSGWNNLSANLSPADVGAHGTGNLNNSTETNSQSQTIYKSYIDPATAMGTLADSYYRLMGRNPTSQEYQAFLNTVYGYQDQENTGKFETKTSGPNVGNIDPSTGQPVDSSGSTSGTSTQTNVVSQRGIGTRGVQFLAGQQAIASPEEGAYQAATTYFNAFIKALSGPAAGMQASGPTTTVP
jgi:hypothetical protein